jgi:NADH-quinone oxidoreductase subunit N
MFYLGLETASIPLACLVAFDKYKQNSAEAAAKYILNAALSSGILVYGLSFIYGTCGTLYFANVPSMLDMTVLQVAGLVMFLAGMGFKISLVPFHMWTPDVYQGAPTSVTAYLSVVSKGAAAFALMTVLFKVFAPMAMVWQDLMYGIIILTITLANLFAIRQKDIKRFFAYSSISQAGYVVLGIMAGTAEGMTAMIYYILVYILSNLAAFGVISTVENHTGRVNIDQYNGLYSTNPRMAFVMMLALFSLGGIPPFAGFFSKFFIFTSAAASGYYVLVFIALVNTIISLYYYLLVVKAMFINKTDAPASHFRSEKALVFSLAICVAGIILAGIASCLYGGIGEFTFGM